ncbi:MAG: methyltransferase [Algoriphagus sp.]|jgi:tRNA1Val (adenine37-N6)-methyltransferase|uniref:tRNA1(Val) (adenine(37)-N6)-methyltransferase n=1 Tax=Algoriphagus sp. TaxID=1872435 RepID=UPI002636AEEE|nr:methyltransferase [Algoriphagus sp.]MDG1279589.1 methyltransferase [Algoriphagus sp.]
MGNSWFQFQKFRINQDRTAMKISTDAVLLGALAKKDDPAQILDIGTGTGVIALMLAQRYPNAKILGIELDQDAAEQAKRNAEASVFSERVRILQMPIQGFETPLKFDLIVSNPPYFPDHLKSTDQKRNQALHTDQLSFEELLGKVEELLDQRGSFWVILPPRQMQDFLQLAEKKSLFPYEVNQVRDSPGKKVQREIVGFSFENTLSTQKEILIKSESGEAHESYSSVVTGFLLNF